MLLIMVICFAAFGATPPPVYLVNVSKPSKSNGYKGYPYRSCSSPKVKLGGGLSWYGGFTLNAPSGTEFVTFPLDGSYSKLMFVVAPEDKYRRVSDKRSTEPSIITIHASGRKVFDHVIRGEDVPQRFTIDIEGATELQFKLVRRTLPVGIAEATLWKKGETPYETGNPRPKTARPITLMKDLQPYYTDNVTPVGPTQECKNLTHAGVNYNSALAFNMVMPLSGRTIGLAHFYTRGQYSKVSFITSMLKGKGSGWLIVKADGKVVKEIHLQSGELPQQMTLDIGNCDMLSFCSENETGDTKGGFMDIRLYPPGHEPAPTLAGGEPPVDPRLKTLPDVCKLMSSIKPYYKVSSVKKQIYDGESDYVTFSMGGQKFSEGIVLYKTGSFFDDDLTSVASFDLGREFDYVRFTTGYIGKSEKMNNDVLRVWADDKIVFEHPLIATYPNQTFTVPINKCRRLRFANMGSGNLSIAAFGIGDILLFRGEPVETDLFARSIPERPPEIDLMDLGKPYLHYVSGVKEILHDGSTMREYFDVNGKKVYKGFLLKTSTYFSFDFGVLSSNHEGGVAGALGDTMGNEERGMEYDPAAEKRREEAEKRKQEAKAGGTENAAAAIIGSTAVGAAFVGGTAAIGGVVVGSTLAGVAAFLAIAAGGEAHENSLAAFNTYGQYNSLTFTVEPFRAYPDSRPSMKRETLLIGADRNVIAKMNVWEGMEPRTVTVPIAGCQQLLFWLSHTGSSSAQYLFSDIKVSKTPCTAFVPEDMRYSDAIISYPVWHDFQIRKAGILKTFPNTQYGDPYGVFKGDLRIMYGELQRLWKRVKPDYQTETRYLETESGQLCKMVCIKDKHLGLLSIDAMVSEWKKDVSLANEIKQKLINCTISGKKAAFAAVFGPKEMKQAVKEGEEFLKECKVMLKKIMACGEANQDRVDYLYRNAVIADGISSNYWFKILPLAPGEVPPYSGNEIGKLQYYQSNYNKGLND